jgi:protein SCO1/2
VTRSKLIATALGILLALAIGFALSNVFLPSGNLVGGLKVTGTPLIGGPFHLTDDQGRPRTDEDFRGRLMLIYFGYTHCPDVCPTSLATMGSAIDLLGAGAEQKVAGLFITLDPERDTVEQLKGYAEQFGPGMLGLTGNAEQIAEAARAYKVYYRKAEPQRGEPYLVDHSSIIYLMGKDGRYVANFTPDAAPADIAKTLRANL